MLDAASVAACAAARSDDMWAQSLTGQACGTDNGWHLINIGLFFWRRALEPNERKIFSVFFLIFFWHLHHIAR